MKIYKQPPNDIGYCILLGRFFRYGYVGHYAFKNIKDVKEFVLKYIKPVPSERASIFKVSVWPYREKNEHSKDHFRQFTAKHDVKY